MISVRTTNVKEANRVMFRISYVCLVLSAMGRMSFCQQLPAVNPPQPGTTAANGSSDTAQPESKRILWIIPNYRTVPTLKNFEPLSSREKFKIATKDSFDRGTFILAGMFGGFGQLTNANPSFGQGAAGFGKYYGTSLADFVIGNYMTEAIYPSLLHQDPRYFRRGTGSGWSRFGYAAGQIFWTHTDTGKGQFNYSEILGNSTGVAISNAYYPDNRTATDSITRLGTQLGVDMASNILKEFWPEIERTFKRKHHNDVPASSP